MDYTIEEHLFQGLRNREDAAFVHLRKTCFEMVYHLARSNSNCEVDPEDLYHEGIYCLFDSIDKPDWEMKSKIKTLFFKICENQYYKILRKHYSEQTFLNEQRDNSYEENFEEKLDRKVYNNIFWSSFNKLKDDCQHILNEFMENVPLEKIAEGMKLSTNYIHKKKKKCYTALVNIVYAHPEYAMIRQSEKITIA